jgi:hypothetical protein
MSRPLCEQRNGSLCGRNALDHARLHLATSPLYGLSRHEAELFYAGVCWGIQA